MGAFGKDNRAGIERILDRLALHVFHHASHHPRRLGVGRHGECQSGERDARDQPHMPAVHAAVHGNLLNDQINRINQMTK